MLFRNGRFEASYYLAGYAVECALKACIAKKTKRFDFPDKSLAIGAYSHDLLQLAKVADVDEEIMAESANDPLFLVQWTLARKWSEQSRYHSKRKEEAQALLKAVGDRKQGILRWIRQHW